MHTFCLSLELEEVIAYINRISIKENNLKAELYKTPAANEGFPMLLIKWTSHIDEHTLTFALEAATKQERDKDFVLDILSNCSATVTFQKCLTEQGRTNKCLFCCYKTNSLLASIGKSNIYNRDLFFIQFIHVVSGSVHIYILLCIHVILCQKFEYGTQKPQDVVKGS